VLQCNKTQYDYLLKFGGEITMAHVLVHHKVEDYDKWKAVFDEHSGARAQNGSKGGKYSETQIIQMIFLFCLNGIILRTQNASPSQKI
jgi:hypothetical protein